MALSGSYYENVGSHWRLQLEWTATQNVANNTSTVTAKMYWMARTQYGVIRSSASKDGSIWLDGTWYDFSGSGLANLNGNQKKLIKTVSKTITHKNDGTQSFGLDGYFSPEVTLSGKYYGKIDMKDGQRWNLNTIPRKSSLTSSRNFTAGSNYTLSLSRASSTFTHVAHIDVLDSGGSWRHIKTLDFSKSQTSRSSSFSTAENTEIFKYLNGRSSMQTRINFHTHVNGSSIGYDTYTGTVTSPSASSISNSGQNVYPDQTISIPISRANSAFTHTLRITTNGEAVHVKTVTGVGSSYSWTPTSAERNILYGAMPSETSKDGNIEITTYYNGQQVRSSRNMDINFYVRNSNPTFNSSTVTYADTNSTTKGITGDDQKIVQKLSTIRVTLPVGSRALAKNSASIVRYIATLGNQEKTANYSTSANVNFDFSGVDAGVNQTVTIQAVDSRGYRTKLTKTITMIPYTNPVMSGQVRRRNGFEDATTVSAKGTMRSLNIGGEKNTIKTIRYRYKKTTEATSVTTWANWRTMSFTRSGTTATASNVSLTLDNGTSFNFEFQITDNFTTTTQKLTLSQGKPIMFVDAGKKNVGINKFPESSSNAIEIGGDVEIKNTGWVNLKIKTLTSGQDPSLKLISSSDNEWAMVNDTSDGGHYDIRYNNSRKVRVTKEGNMTVNGDVNAGGNMSVGGTLTLPSSRYKGDGGGINARNSDVWGVNSLWFGGNGNDVSNNQGEGLVFPKTSTPADSSSVGDYDTLTILDGVVNMNGIPMYFQRTEVLWEGAVYMKEGQRANTSRRLEGCPNGWILVWSDYDPGGSWNNFDFNYTFIHKTHMSQWEGTGTYHVLSRGTAERNENLHAKYIYVHQNYIEGHAMNDDGHGADVCLRRIVAW